MHEVDPATKLGAGRLHELSPRDKKPLLVGTYENTKNKGQCEEQLLELESLGDTFGLEKGIKLATPIREIDASTYIGSGKVEEIRQMAMDHEVGIVIFDDEISPQQQRNLEKAIQKPVIDRAELILGVFAQRAQTREAKIQVEIAAARYQMPRLTRLWTHFSRQKVGGGGKGGFLKGEGEKQIELDRRILRRKLVNLEKELKEVKKHRDIQRRSRIRTGIPTFAIVGYTNAGKSTLLNALTEADVLAEDKLFATLDTTTRKFTLPNKQEILLIDTVGFIRKLPHLLIASFNSTLEEAIQADILLHLIDVSNPQAGAQVETTFNLLKELKAEKKPIIHLLNKVDQCESRLMIEKMRITYPKTVEISALKQEGFDRLYELMIREISLLRRVVRLRIPQTHYALVSEVMRDGKVISIEYEENDVLLEAEIPEALERKVSLFLVT